MLPASTPMSMQVERRLLGFVAALAALGPLAACEFPTPSKHYACDKDTDCDPERVCSPAKYCVLPSSMEPDGGVDTDAAPIDSAMIDGDPFAATRAACLAAGYTQEATTSGLYRFVTTGANWTNARTDCENDVAGATHVITLSNDTEVAYQRATQLDAWIGWVDRPTEGMWHVLTAEVPVLNYQAAWASNRPDGGSDENCALMRSGGIDDVDCPQAHRYICECDGQAVLH